MEVSTTHLFKVVDQSVNKDYTWTLDCQSTPVIFKIKKTKPQSPRVLAHLLSLKMFVGAQQVLLHRHPF